jgi:DNA-binding transcriptional regulator YbjK
MVKVDGRLERGISTRERILDAAIEVIARGGQSAATQRTVADQAGVSLASITYYFATAKELLTAAMRRAAGIAVAYIEAMEGRVISGEISLEDATVEYIEIHRNGQFAAGLVAMELQMAAVRDPELRDSGEANIESLRASYEPVVAAPGLDRAAAAAFTGLLFIELGSNREANSADTRLRVRTMIDLFGLEEGIERRRRALAEVPRSGESAP